MIAKTPQTPYYAVIFTSLKTSDTEDYGKMSELMTEMAQKTEGFIGMETAQSDVGITVSYWKSLEAIQKWKMQSEHRAAQQKGKEKWYDQFMIRICKVERDYGFVRESGL